MYDVRFEPDRAYRAAVWRVLSRRFFRRWVGSGDTVLDLGCGYGDFINAALCRARWGMDLNPASSSHLDRGVQFVHQDCTSAWPLGDRSLDVVFSSNLFEHLPDRDHLLRALREAFRCLRPGGRLLAVGPNVRVIPGRYWDFFDHQIPLSEASLAEALRLCGFQVERAVARFLPFSMVGAPRYPLFAVRLYAAVPAVWRFFGAQFLVVARRPAPRAGPQRPKAEKESLAGLDAGGSLR